MDSSQRSKLKNDIVLSPINTNLNTALANRRLLLTPHYSPLHHHIHHHHSPVNDVVSPLFNYLRTNSLSPLASSNDLLLSPPPTPSQLTINVSSKGSSSSAPPRLRQRKRKPFSEVAVNALAVDQDDVLVMDGIMLDSGSSSSSSPSLLRRSEICRAWEEFRQCRYGASCLFAHGKEELHSLYKPNKRKSEARMSKSYLGSPYHSDGRFGFQVMPSEAMSPPAIKLLSPINAAKLRDGHSPITIRTRAEYNSQHSPSPSDKTTASCKTEDTSNTEDTNETSGSPSKSEHTSMASPSSVASEDTNETAIINSDNKKAPISLSKTEDTSKLVHSSETSAFSSSESENTIQTPASSKTKDGIKLEHDSQASASPCKSTHSNKASPSSITSAHTSKAAICCSDKTNKTPVSSKKTEDSIQLKSTGKTPASPNKSEHIRKAPCSPDEPKLPSSLFTPESGTDRLICQDWSPLDDGIQITLPSKPDEQPSREEVDDHINSVLYCQKRTKRFSVFLEIAPWADVDSMLKCAPRSLF